MSTIMLVDSVFPHVGGEQFIENEYPVLSKAFDNVVIVPIDAEDLSNVVDLKDNIIVYPEKLRLSKGESLFYILRSLFRLPVWEECLLLIKEDRLNVKNLKKLINYWRIAEYKYRKICKWIDSNRIPKADVYYSYWANVQLLICVLLRKRYRTGLVISRTHGHDLYLERNEGYIPFRNYLFKNCETMYTISEQGQKYLTEHYPEHNSLFKLSYLGTKDYGCGHSSDDGKFRIVSCSSIIKLKRIDRIIDALALARNINYEWHHFGDGEGRKGTEQHADEKLHTADFVFHGSVSNGELLSWYSESCADVFINVSETEGLPVSIMEAMSFGIPVIATNVGGTSEIVKDNVNGVLLDKNFTDEDLCNAIKKIYSLSPDCYNLMRSQARSTWEENFSAKENYAKFYECLNRMV